MFALVVFIQNSLRYTPLPAFGTVSGPFSFHIWIQTVPEITSYELGPRLQLSRLNRPGVNAPQDEQAFKQLTDEDVLGF